MAATTRRQELLPLARQHMPRGLAPDPRSKALSRAVDLAGRYWHARDDANASSSGCKFGTCGWDSESGYFGGLSGLSATAGDIVAAGDQEFGFHISQRASLRGTHDRDSEFGAATGRQIEIPVVANLVILDGQIVLAHRLCNEIALLEQLGFDPPAVASKYSSDIRDPADWAALRHAGAPKPALSAADPVSGFDPDAFVRDTHHRIWAMADFMVLSTHYARDFAFEGLTSQPLQGAEAYEAFVRAFRASFPDLRQQVDEVFWMGNRGEGFHVATRWSAEATHAGTGLFGAPTGAPVRIWGITQQRMKSGHVQREFMLMNDFDLMVQIAAYSS